LRHFHPVRLVWLPALLALALPACSKQGVIAPNDNQRPVAQFSRAPSRSADLYSYTYEMFWTGFDPDGEVREFLYAVDPPSPTAAAPEPDTAWTRTTLTRASFRFDATEPQPAPPGTNPVAVSYHTLVLKAVDERGLESEPAVVSFNASTVAPSVTIISPGPSSRSAQFLPPSLYITWVGSDIDGVLSRKPTHYRVKLLTASTPITPALLVQYPDTLHGYYQPRGWATWDSLGPDASSYSFLSLSPEQVYAFAVIAFDEAGAYTPYARKNRRSLL